MTFEEAFREYQASRSISERTRGNERYALESHLAALKTRRVQEITSSEVARLLQGMRDCYSSWTQNGVHTAS